MAFKRYINKHGKKLGPYYYENVRDRRGKVKSVYLGTNPHHHQKHRIRKPLFFLILVLTLALVLGGSLFLLQNKSYLIKRAGLQEPDFDIDQILLKVLIKSGESLEKQARVMNTGDEQATISVEISGLYDIVKSDTSSFIIKPGQTKIIALNFLSSLIEQKIEQQPGVYVGKLIVKSEKASKEIPIVVEIETKNVLFDMNLNPVAIERKIKQGTDTTIEVRLFNLQSVESVNVDVEYFVKDMNGNTIITESETVVVKTQASFFKTISIPKNLKPGPYVFAAQVKFGNSVGTASYLFDVTGPEAEASFVQFCKNSVLCLGLSLTTILLLFAITAYFYFLIGAYLYEKVTGAIMTPKRREEAKSERAEAAAEKPRESIFEKIRNGLAKRRKEKERKKAQKEKLRRERELQRIVEERNAQIEARKRQLEEERLEKGELRKKTEEEAKRKEEIRKKEIEGKIRQEEQRLAEEKGALEAKNRQLEEEKRKREGLQRLKELEKQNAEKEKKKREEQLKRQTALEAKERDEERKRIKLKREKLRKERNKKIREFFHKIGLFRTAEEKRQIAIQKEKERLEKIRGKEALKSQRELVQKRKEQERLAEERRRQLEAATRSQEEQKRGEELQKQKELKIQKRLRGEEEKKRQKELEKKRLEQQKLARERENQLEKQRQQKARAQKLENIKQIEGQLDKNSEACQSLNSELGKLESEKRIFSSNINEIAARVKRIDGEITDKLRYSHELKLQKNSLLENRKKQDGDSRIGELKAKLAEKRTALIKDMEGELSKLSPEKRKATEKWKKLEVKAKLKIEEQNLEEEIKRLESEAIEERKKTEENYKKSLAEISKKQREIREAIAVLESQKQQIALESEKISRERLDKDNEMQRITLDLENAAKKREMLSLELSKLKSGLPSWNFFRNIMASHKERAQRIKKLKEEAILRLGAEKKKQEQLKKREELKTREKESKDLQERQRAEELKKKREPEAKKRQEEVKKEKGIEREKLRKHKRQGAKGFLHKIGLYSTPEEKKQIAIQKEKERKKITSEMALKQRGFEEGKRKREEQKGLENKKNEEKKAKAKKSEEQKEEPKRKHIKKEGIFRRLFKMARKKGPEPEKKITGKSKNFEQFYESLSNSKEAIDKKDISKAKELYIKARDLYGSLNYTEKKEAFGELTRLFNKLK